MNSSIVVPQWLIDNPAAARRQLILARMTVLPFVAIGAWAIMRWTNRLYGRAAALLAAAMWLLNADVLTNSAVVAADLPASATGLLAGYLYWEWLRSDPRPFPWTVAMAVAFAILCNFSWLRFVPALPSITLIHDWLTRRRSRRTSARNHEAAETRDVAASPSGVFRDSIRLVCAFLLSLLIINVVYGFDGTGTRLGDYRFRSSMFGGVAKHHETHRNRFSEGPAAWIPLPLPKQMVLGLDVHCCDFETGLRCYLRGQTQSHGWWYLHIYAMAVKIPLGYWALIVIGALSLVWDAVRGQARGEIEWLPLVIGTLFVACVSFQTGLTHQLGHSNVDWGQSTYRIADWAKRHPDKRPLTVFFVPATAAVIVEPR